MYTSIGVKEETKKRLEKLKAVPEQHWDSLLNELCDYLGEKLDGSEGVGAWKFRLWRAEVSREGVSE